MLINFGPYLKPRFLLISALGLAVIYVLMSQISTIKSEPSFAIAGTYTHDKVIALTFDLDNGDRVISAILDALKAHNTKASFFITGMYVSRHPEPIQRILAEGHEIGYKWADSKDSAKFSPEQMFTDLDKSHTVLKKFTGIEPSLIRPGDSNFSRESLKIADQLGYKTISWNVDSKDLETVSPDCLISQVGSALKPGAIILMHASDRAIITSRSLPALLESIKSSGYQVVTVGELLQKHSEKGLARY